MLKNPINVEGKTVTAEFELMTCLEGCDRASSTARRCYTTKGTSLLYLRQLHARWGRDEFVLKCKG